MKERAWITEKKRAWITAKKIASNYNEKDNMNNSEIERMNYKEKWAWINVKKEHEVQRKRLQRKKKNISHCETESMNCSK